MIKKDFQFENFDGEKETRTLHFHLTKLELVRLARDYDEINAWIKDLEKDPTKLVVDDMLKLADLIELFVTTAYGERLGDDQFVKSPEALKSWQASASYGDFLFSFFEDPEEMADFLGKLLPKSVLQQVQEEMTKDEVRKVSDKPTADETAALRARLAELEAAKSAD